MNYSKIKCFFVEHDWNYNNTKDEILFDSKSGEYIGYQRFCKRCCKKQARQIVDFGRTVLWVNTNKYSKQELREINLKKILE
jgi:hypothetical protein